MRRILIIPFCLIFLFSCSIDDENKSSEKTYTNSMGTSLTITKANWRTSVESSYVGITGGLSFLSTILNVSGKTNGDSIKIKSTLGDSLTYKLINVQDSTFSDEVLIFYTVRSTVSIPKVPFKTCASILVFKGADTLNVMTDSVFLKYQN
jgi:hypothetical protein